MSKRIRQVPYLCFMRKIILIFLIFLIPVNVFAKTYKPIKDKKGNTIGRFIFPDEWIIEEDKYVFRVKLNNLDVGFISVNPFNTLKNEKQMQKDLAKEDNLEFHEEMKVSPKGIKYYYYTLTRPDDPLYLAEKYVVDLEDAIISFNINQGKDNHYALDFINMIDTDKTVPLDYTESTTEEETEESTEEEKKQEKEDFLSKIHKFIISLFHQHL